MEQLRDYYGLTSLREAMELKEDWELTHKDLIIAGKIIRVPYTFDSKGDSQARPRSVIRDDSNEAEVCCSDTSG